MKFEIESARRAAAKPQENGGHPNGDYVGTAEWEGPGRVALDMPDEHKAFFERYFYTEQSYMAPAGNHDGMTYEKPADSESAFNHALYQLAAYAYKVRQGDDRRRGEGRGAGKPVRPLAAGVSPLPETEEAFRPTRSEEEKKEEARKA